MQLAIVITIKLYFIKELLVILTNIFRLVNLSILLDIVELILFCIYFFIFFYVINSFIIIIFTHAKRVIWLLFMLIWVSHLWLTSWCLKLTALSSCSIRLKSTLNYTSLETIPKWVVLLLLFWIFLPKSLKWNETFLLL